MVAYAQNPTQDHKYSLRMDTPALPAGLVLVGDVPQVTITAIGSSDHMRAFDIQLRANPSLLHIKGNFSGTHVGKNDVGSATFESFEEPYIAKIAFEHGHA